MGDGHIGTFIAGSGGSRYPGKAHIDAHSIRTSLQHTRNRIARNGQVVFKKYPDAAHRYIVGRCGIQQVLIDHIPRVFIGRTGAGSINAILRFADAVVHKTVVAVAHTQAGCPNGGTARAYSEQRLGVGVAHKVAVDHLVVRGRIRGGSH